MIEFRQAAERPLAENPTFPTTSTGEVGEVRKQTRNQHPHHHPSRGCGGVVWRQRSLKTLVGKINTGPAAFAAGSGPLPFGISSLWTIQSISAGMPGPFAGAPRVTMAKSFDEAGDGSRKVTSALRHKITRRAEPDGSKVVEEKRGIRRATWSVPTPGARPKVDTESARVFGLMTMAANRHLRAVGEMDAIAVMETAERLSSEYPSAQKISQHMRLWAENIKTQKGALSIDATAARFLQSADHLLQILDQTPAMQSAAFAFADAWHWWHLELYGEHALAAKAKIAERSVAGLKAGPKALKRNRALREAIIETKYKKHALTADKIDRVSPLRAAGAILKAVAADFRKQDLGGIQKSTLERALRKIIRERGKVDDR